MVNFTLQHVMTNQECQWFQSRNSRFERLQSWSGSEHWPLPNWIANVRMTIKLNHAFITWLTTCWRQGSPWLQWIQGRPLRSPVLTGYKIVKTATASLECKCIVCSLLFLLSLFFLPLPPPLQCQSFLAKALYALQSKHLKCFSISNWK